MLMNKHFNYSVMLMRLNSKAKQHYIGDTVFIRVKEHDDFTIGRTSIRLANGSDSAISTSSLGSTEAS